MKLLITQSKDFSACFDISIQTISQKLKENVMAASGWLYPATTRTLSFVLTEIADNSHSKPKGPQSRGTHFIPGFISVFGFNFQEL